MALVVESASAKRRTSADGTAGRHLDVALVNTMPDAALLQTEDQFGSLLAAAAGDDVHIRLRHYTLPGVPRREAAAERIREHYFPIEALWDAGPSAVIVTGSEPLAADLRDEPYWADLQQLLETATVSTASTIASCLSAHAALLAFDGVRRVQRPQKCSGVYAQRVATSHSLARGLPDTVRMPHSRLNDVPVEAIIAHNYQPLLSSAEVGWTVAVKQFDACLLVLMQGHPEYEPTTLLQEYRRDVRRYLNSERNRYPGLPEGYLPADLEHTFASFREEALDGAPRPELMDRFPFELAAENVEHVWRRPAEQLYANWLAELTSREHFGEIAHAR